MNNNIINVLIISICANKSPQNLLALKFKG